MQTPIADKYKRIIIFILLVCSVLIFFPGSYSVDTWDMYAAAKANRYEDWHSVFMPYLWRLLLLGTGKFYSIYIFQMIWYWVFWELVLVRVYKSNLAFFTGLIFAVWMLSVPQYVMKDAEFFLAWGTGVVLMIISANNPKYKWKWVTAIFCFLFLCYGYLLRPNNVFAFSPLLYVFAAVYLFKAGVWKRLIFSCSMILVLLLGYYYVTYKVLYASKTYPQYKLQLLDVVGITKATGENYIPANVATFKNYDKNKLLAAYTPASIDDIYWPTSTSVLPRPDSLLEDSVHYYWKQAIFHHPIVYLKNRYEGFLYYLKIKKRWKVYANLGVWTDPENPFHEKSLDNVFVRRFLNVYRLLDHTPFYDPWLWLCLNAILFLFFVYKERRSGGDLAMKVLACMCLSGVLYTLSQFPVFQYDRDFRYTYWNVFISLICIVYIFDNYRIRKLD